MSVPGASIMRNEQRCQDVTNVDVEVSDTLPPIIMVQWKMGVSPILVSFHLGDPFSTEPMDSWEKGYQKHPPISPSTFLRGTYLFRRQFLQMVMIWRKLKCILAWKFRLLSGYLHGSNNSNGDKKTCSYLQPVNC